MNFKTNNSLLSMKKGLSLTALATAVALGTGCSNPDDPDSPTGLNTSPVGGTVIDAYLAGATIYVDGNNNGKRDSWEPTAVTDKDGYFTTSASGFNYCGEDASTAEARHCLRSGESSENAILRAYGGFDVLTGEPFIGSLASTVDLSGDTVPNQIISPLTSVAAEGGVDITTLLNRLGINSADLDKDFLGSSDFDSDLINVALKLHKVVQLYADLIDERFKALGEEPGFPQSSSSLIYKAFAEEIVRVGGLNGIDASALNNILGNVNDAIEALYNAEEGVSFPGDATSATLVSDAQKILGLVDSAIPLNNSNISGLDAARARMVGIELILNKMNKNALDLDQAIDLIEDTASQYYTDLNNAPNIDFSALNDFNFNTNIADFSGAIIGGSGNTFASMDGQQLFIDYADAQSGISGKALFMFNADESGSAGTLDLCIRYNDVNADDDDIYNTEGELVELAQWFTIDDHRMVMTVAGAYDLTLISRGEQDGQHLYSMGYGGETASWSSSVGLGANISETIPKDDATCQSVLDNLSAPANVEES